MIRSGRKMRRRNGNTKRKKVSKKGKKEKRETN
jgi:hypothetical protein